MSYTLQQAVKEARKGMQSESAKTADEARKTTDSGYMIHLNGAANGLIIALAILDAELAKVTE